MGSHQKATTFGDPNLRAAVLLIMQMCFLLESGLSGFDAKARLQTMGFGALGNLAANHPNNQVESCAQACPKHHQENPSNQK